MQVNFKLKEKFNFPDKIDDACPVMETSIMAIKNKTVLSFTTEWGLLSVIDINTGNLTSFAKGSSADQYLFDGFTSMKIATNFRYSWRNTACNTRWILFRWLL